MGVSTCPRCGAEYEYGHDGDDSFTSVSVTYHDDDRDDFAASICQDCGDELLADLTTEVEA
ncbi:hypothetical protein [Halobacterium sp. BOL4-2]|uniref:hypothetical protein n=1 Tax=Halobacterium sp. BOL4-2 TaxID=2810537 RepID=UPI0019654107|nr:hypothetical protein [Halobacterium sp. BOL4-2]QRY26392.1 hypothetical protein JRZ79_13155 [Halobacterium sp. BOL4-2]